MPSYPKTKKKKKFKFKLKATSCAEQLYMGLRRWWAHKKKQLDKLKIILAERTVLTD